jgi:Holliday junction resolvasome RuvABC endonuclease subunit
MMPTAIMGLDPSSKKLAVVTTWSDRVGEFRVDTLALQSDEALRTDQAYQWMRTLVHDACSGLQPYDVFVFQERPVLGKGGIGSTIPQAQVGGAATAGAVSAGAQVNLVNNQTVKKKMVIGNASKDQIAFWCREYWPSLYAATLDEKGNWDQDLCDAAMINRYGAEVVRIRQRIRDGKRVIRIKRKKEPVRGRASRH